tara:strand:+ start:2828 stop:3214 length:387 start_codon:yes stop_codon:yes gene_type:complete
MPPRKLWKRIIKEYAQCTDQEVVIYNLDKKTIEKLEVLPAENKSRFISRDVWPSVTTNITGDTVLQRIVYDTVLQRIIFERFSIVQSMIECLSLNSDTDNKDMKKKIFHTRYLKGEAKTLAYFYMVKE